MANARSRLASLVAQFVPPAASENQHLTNSHTLSPTLFLPRAAAIEPDVCFLVYLIGFLTEKLAGRSYTSYHCKWKIFAAFISRGSRSCQRVGILHPNARLQKGRNTLSKYSCIFGVDLWISRGRSRYSWYATYAFFIQTS